METKEATQLGSPIGGVLAISTTLRDKVDALKIMGGRLAHLATHDALLYTLKALLCPAKAAALPQDCTLLPATWSPRI